MLPPRLRVVVLLSAALACRGERRHEGSDGSAIGPPVATDKGPGDASDLTPLDCGEPGPARTARPAHLFETMVFVEEVTVWSDQTARSGALEVKYESDVRQGEDLRTRGPQLSVVLDPSARKGSAPLRTTIAIPPRGRTQKNVGYYRVEVVRHEQIARVRVERRTCSTEVVVPVSPQPTWLWLSTEAVETVRLGDLEVSLASRDRVIGAHLGAAAAIMAECTAGSSFKCVTTTRT